jgi:hypothetical protein
LVLEKLEGRELVEYLGKDFKAALKLSLCSINFAQNTYR